jgi:hypothetical protein
MGPPGEGDVIWDAFRNKGSFEEESYRGLYETWFFKCGYMDPGLVARFLRKHPQVADFYLSFQMIGMPVIKSIVSKLPGLIAAGAGGLSGGGTASMGSLGGMSGGIPPQVSEALSKFKEGFSTGKELHSNLTTAKDLLSGQWGRDVYSQASQTVQKSMPKSGNKPIDTGVLLSTPYHRGGKWNELKPSSKDITTNLPTLPGRKEGDELIAEFESSFNQWAFVTQVTPIRIMDAGFMKLLHAHKVRIMRIRSLCSDDAYKIQEKVTTAKTATYLNKFFTSPDRVSTKWEIIGLAGLGEEALLKREGTSFTDITKPGQIDWGGMYGDVWKNIYKTRDKTTDWEEWKTEVLI